MSSEWAHDSRPRRVNVSKSTKSPLRSQRSHPPSAADSRHAPVPVTLGGSGRARPRVRFPRRTYVANRLSAFTARWFSIAMAATSHTDTDGQVYECSHCGGDRSAPASVAGSFCSLECYRDHRRSKRAAEILETIEHDHRFCRTCFAQLKETNKPPRSVIIGPSRHQEWDNAKDVLVGYQYRLEAALIGEISRDVDDEAQRPIVEDGVITGTICGCGATDHRDADETCRESVAWHAIVAQLVTAAKKLREEEKHDVDFDTHILEHLVQDDVPVREALTRAVVLDE